jgi:peptide/nickel transport system substrate-binding protein
LAIAAGFAAPGCTARSPAAAEDRTLRIGARGTNEALAVIRQKLFAEGLLALDWQGKPSQRLATSWQWEDNGLALRVQLHPGIHFHDGTPVNAPTVLKILKQKIGKSQTNGFEAIKNIEAVNDLSLLFHLTRLDGFLTSTLASILIVDDEKPNVGTGPFRLVPASRKTTAVEAVRNDSYYLGKPGIDRIEVTPYATPRATWVGLLKGDVNMAAEVNGDSVEFLDAAKFHILPSVQPFYIPLVFNVRKPILARAEVRRAISDAIDRQEIVSQAMRDRGLAAETDDPVWPSYWAYNAGTTAARRHPYSPSTARDRLDAAGLPVRPAVAGHKASRFQLKCVFYNEEPQFERIGLLLQRQLAAVGIDLVLEGLNYNDLVARLTAGDFESYLFQLTSGRDVSYAYRFWRSPRGALGRVMQNTGYDGADDVFDRLRQAREEEDIRIAIGDLRQRFFEDVPAVFLAWPKTTRAVDARFDIGNLDDPEISVFGNLWRWRLAPPQTASR